MTVARRLAALETSLTPTQLVLRWLDEAHQYGSFEAHAATILDVPLDDMPLNRLCREAEGSARSVRGRSREEVDRSVRKALTETVFRFFLVLRANVTTHATLDKETCIQAAMASFVAMLIAPEKRSPDYGLRLGQTCNVLMYRVAGLESAATARMRAAERYLDGREMLFPELVTAWDEGLTQAREQTALALRIAELDDVEVPESADDDLERRIEAALGDLVEWSKATALEKLGEGPRALRIARSWLRPQLSHEPTDTSFGLGDEATL